MMLFLFYFLITSQVRLTAQFVAKNGRSFLNQLMQREAKNFQFDFLRPQHSLFQYFTKLVDQYTKVSECTICEVKHLHRRFETIKNAWLCYQMQYKAKKNTLFESNLLQRRLEHILTKCTSCTKLHLPDHHGVLVIHVKHYQTENRKIT